MIPAWKIYPSSQRRSTVYLKNVVKNPFIEVGDYTVYDDFVNDPRDFERNNVLYHYPECNHDRLRIGRFCSIACRREIHFQCRQSCDGQSFDLHVPAVFRGMGSSDGYGVHR